MDKKSKKRLKHLNGTTEDIPTILIQVPSDDKIVDVSCDNEDEKKEEDEEYAEDPGNTGRRRSLRRNSISLPNLDDLEVIKDQISVIQEGSTRSDISNSENEITEDEELPSYIPPRNARRKSVTSPAMLKPPGEDESGGNSPANSITSVNSLASLLREKMQMLPTTFKKKKSPDYKIKIFVALLFIAIISLVSTAYALYYEKLKQRTYFEHVKLDNIQRQLLIHNHEGLRVISGRLGVTINYEKVFPCLPSEEVEPGTTCLEWLNRARLYLRSFELFNVVKCYNIKWVSLSDNLAPTDCFEMSNSSHWYGGGQTAQETYLLERGHHDFAPFITGSIDKHQWGNTLNRYFINSKGAAIIVDNATPLHVAVQGTHTKELCLRAQYDDFAFVNRWSRTPQLNYSVCVGIDSLELHSSLTENTLWDGLKKEDIDVIHSLLTEPLWEITSASRDELTEETISNYTENVISLGFLKQGHVLINEFWQKHVGDFSVDTERFPTLEESINIMHRRGFRIVFSIQPFISTESFNFAEAVRKRLLISERFSDRRIPALTRYKSVQSAGVLDVTNNRTIPWLLDQLKSVMDKYQFDAYYLDLGLAYNMPHYYQCEKLLINPDHYKTIFINKLQSSVSLFGVNSAINLPRAPTFVSLPSFESSWSGLRRVIPTVLTYGIGGYPFLIPGAVGGDFEAPETTYNVTFSSELLPDKELYVRWLQLATFLPVIRFTYLPSTYEDERVLDMAKLLTTLRQQKVTPLLKKYARVSLDTGLPLIRPLWMLDADDITCYSVVDEFSIGDDLIVAPVLHFHARAREVYLPAGVWKDGIDGSLRKGSRWIHDYRVEENQIAYFEKMPDDTRF